MTGLGRDLRDAWRGLLHERAFSATALLMLSLGIAASSAIFAALQAVIVELPFDDPERIVTVRRMGPANESLPISLEQFNAWRSATDAFEAVAGYSPVSPVMTGRDAALRLQAEAITPSMFAVLGVQPALGRTFRDDDAAVAVVSDAFWRTRLDADPLVLGRPLILDGVPTTVVGVMPPGFDGPRSRPGDIWVPFTAERAVVGKRPPSVNVVARVARGVTPAAAAARLDGLRVQPDSTRWTVSVETARQDFLYQDALSSMNVLIAGVGLVLVMACVNVASLFLGRGMSRRRELAIRLAMGATRWHLIRQVTLESLLLSSGAAVVGLLLASWAVAAMVPLIPGWFPRIAQIDVDWGVAAFAVVAAAITGALVSVWPAWSASRQDAGSLMKSGERGNSGGARRARTALVVVEATLAMTVLSAAAMLVGSFNRLNPTSPGFEFADRAKFSVRFAGVRYEDPSARIAAVEGIVEGLRSIPGVTQVSSVTQFPLSGTTTVFPVRVNGADDAGRPPTVHFRSALPNYLESMGMPIVAGRGLTTADGARSQPVTVVSEALVARMLGGREPLDSELVIEEPNGPVVRRIVGVVRDVRGSGSDLRPRPEMYVPYAQSPLALASFVVRSDGGVAPIEAGIRRVMGAFDPGLPVDRVETLRAVVEKSVAMQRFFAMLMGGFAVVALAMAVVGLYSVAAWSVTQRTREIGVRLALGATPGDIRRLVLRYGGAVGITGAIAGTACAIASSRLIESYLFGFPARQPALFAVIGIGFTLVVTLASYMPARRAMRVDPMEALRTE